MPTCLYTTEPQQEDPRYGTAIGRDADRESNADGVRGQGQAMVRPQNPRDWLLHSQGHVDCLIEHVSDERGVQGV